MNTCSHFHFATFCSVFGGVLDQSIRKCLEIIDSMSEFTNWIFSFVIFGLLVSRGLVAVKESVRLHNKTNCVNELTSTVYLGDNQYSASSSLERRHIYRPSAARIINIHSETGPSDGSAWCPENPASREINEWIQVDFKRMAIINTIYTTGRGDGNYKKFTPEILIKYQRSDNGPWFTYGIKQNLSILTINNDARTKIRSNLQTIIARKIRIYPLSTMEGPKPVCLRFALLGCFMEDEAVSYSGPQGDSVILNNVSVDLQDRIYDGKVSAQLHNGLGLLMDNSAWRRRFDLAKVLSDNQISVFTGWSCGFGKKRSFINITFNFDQERDFLSLMMYSVKDLKSNIFPNGPIVVSIGTKNGFSHKMFNTSIFGADTPDMNEVLIDNMPLDNLRGDTFIINITCGSNNLFLLSEIVIKSVPAKPSKPEFLDESKQRVSHHPNSSEKFTTSFYPDYLSKDSAWRQQDITVVAMAFLIFLLLIFFIVMGVVCYKFQRSRRNKLTKKMELVAKSNSQLLNNPISGTVFTIQSKTPIPGTVSQPKFFNENKTSYSGGYSGSQPSDGVYASWPNTDEDADVLVIDKEEEKCLIPSDKAERTSLKEYATYQCGVNTPGTNEYFLTDGSLFIPQVKTRPSSIVTTIPNISTLSVPLPIIVGSYDSPKPIPVVTYRTTKSSISQNMELVSYQHFLNYRGPCGDVDFRYQSSHPKGDQSNVESNIKVLPITSLLPIQPFIRGEFGAISVCKILSETDSPSANCFFVKNINPDSKSVTKSSFIRELKILSSLSSPHVAKLEGIAIDNDMSANDLLFIIKSTKFYILLDYLNGYNLKDFLRNAYYSNVSQDFKSAQTFPYSQISLSSLSVIIAQIASGMKHLEDLGLTHRDLACRNIIIDVRMQIKIYPGGLVTTKPNEDYCSIELANHLVTFPLRWMAPESIIGGVFTIKSDVWSFAVTLWEIFTLCSLIPYGSLTNEALLDLMSHRNHTPRLPCPQSCPKETFDLMSRCWNWEESMRPKFGEIFKFLQYKTLNSTSQAQIILPGPPPDDKIS